MKIPSSSCFSAGFSEKSVKVIPAGRSCSLWGAGSCTAYSNGSYWLSALRRHGNHTNLFYQVNIYSSTIPVLCLQHKLQGHLPLRATFYVTWTTSRKNQKAPSVHQFAIPCLLQHLQNSKIETNCEKIVWEVFTFQPDKKNVITM